MHSALVTGGMGFIGGHLVQALIKKGVQVTIIDKAVNKVVPFNTADVEIIEGDVLSTNLLSSCLKKVDACFHLAAIASVAICERDWLFGLQNNVLAFNQLLNILKEQQRSIPLVYASSAAVYGNAETLPLMEDLHVYPISAYGADKLANEMYAGVAAHNYNVRSVGLRLFNVYGPGQLDSNPYSGVIVQFKKALLNQTPITIYGDGKQTRDFIAIQDVVEAFILAANSGLMGASVFNVCTGKVQSINDIASILMQVMGREVPINYVAKRESDLLASVGNPALAEKKLGFVVKTSLEQGLHAWLGSSLRV